MKKRKKIYSLVVKVAELCNLNCSYCYIYNHEDKSYLKRPKFMSDKVFMQMLLRMKEHCEKHPGHKMGFNFHGGEPTLLGIEKIETFAQQAKAILGDNLYKIGMQTNATLINEDWVRMLNKQKIFTAVSLDGPAETHDAVRVDHSGRGTHSATMTGIKLLQNSDIFSSVLTVINPRKSGLETYKYFRSIGLKKFCFLLPDITHDSKELFYGGLGETPVADYLIPIFDEWFREDNSEVWIRIFWELLKVIMGGGKFETDAFGNPLLNYLIIETDGAIQPLDTLRICKDGLIETGLNVFDHGFDDVSESPLLNQLVNFGIPLCNECISCPEKDVCAGGYLPHRYSSTNGFDNPSAWCADIIKLIAHLRKSVVNEVSA